MAMDEGMMFSLTDLDGVDDEAADCDTLTVECNGSRRAQCHSVSLLKRRRSQHYNLMPPLKLTPQDNGLNWSKNKTSSASTGSSVESTDSGYLTNGFLSPQIIDSTSEISKAKQNWLKALRKIRSLKDPWEEYFKTDLPVERVKRHRYNALKKQWTEDEIYVKMQTEPFGRGAMRECYRLKKVLKSKKKRATVNFVAKRYMESVETSIYFEDVRLQMDAKLWGEEYNRHHPPKKVDIFQVSLVEFMDRQGRPLYHLENFIEGTYIKYNSNSGYVEEHLRYTPQAFSHFTFEQSGHELIVVDIQGVDDLWTDPQIHTADHDGYGDGNLGVGGMALFFHSHMCNSICESLGLSKFDLSPSEIKQQQTVKKSGPGETVIRGQELHIMSPSSMDKTNLFARLMRCSSLTMSRISESDHSVGSEEDLISPPNSFNDTILPSAFMNRRTRYISVNSDDTTSAEEEEQMLQLMKNRRSRSSCISLELQNQSRNGISPAQSILGKIHHSLALYHELGRFGTDIDWEAAGYHEKLAAELGVPDAILTVAKITLNLPHDILTGCTSVGLDINAGVTYMSKAAQAGDRSAMIFMAEAYTTGNGLGTERNISYQKAVEWYLKAIAAIQNDDSEDYDSTMDHPIYLLQAKVAELYLEGGPELDKDYQAAADMFNEAAENATNAMKGRLASTYYCKAEEALAYCEE